MNYTGLCLPEGGEFYHLKNKTKQNNQVGLNLNLKHFENTMCVILGFYETPSVSKNTKIIQITTHQMTYTCNFK